MAGKKDFAGMNTGRVYSTIEQATSTRGQQSKASPQEQAERAATGRTQGRKGCKKDGKRINLLLDPANHQFISVMAKATGRNMTEMCNEIIKAYRNDHPDIMEKAAGLLDFINNSNLPK